MENIKTPPSDLNSEKAVLGSILIRPKCLPEVSKIVQPESFYYQENSIIYSAILELHKNNKPIDLISLFNVLKESNPEITINNLIGLTELVIVSSNVKYHAEEVSKNKTLRDIIEMGSKIVDLGFNKDYENIPVVLSKLQKDFVIKSNKEENITRVLKDFDDRTLEYQEKVKNGLELIGIPSGYNKIDKVIDGIRKGHFWVIGAYTSMGKSSLALNLTSNLIKQGLRVVYYSLEMTQVDIVSRLLGVMGNDNGRSIIKGYPKNKEELEINKQKLVDTNFMVKTDVNELSDLIMSMYEENVIKPVDMFVVDYIQNINLKGSKSEYETSTKVALDLQLSALRLNIPIIALSQISNEGAREKDSQQVMSFKGSGGIGASADLAIEIKLREENNEERIRKLQNGESVMMKLVIKKNRHGEVGFIDVLFNGVTGIFKQDAGLDNF